MHPLPTHLAKRAVPGEEKATPHLIYKKSLQIQVDAETAKRGIAYIFSCLISLVLLLGSMIKLDSIVATDEKRFLCFKKK